MKIKVAILDTDSNYLLRISNAFGSMFAEEVEVYSFTEEKTAFEMIQSGNCKADLLLAGEEFEINPEELPKNCAFAYFVSNTQIDNLRGQKAICKFQKAELIYREMLSLYADVSEVVIGTGNHGEKNTLILAFMSASGGTGSSSAAAACAKRLAKGNKKVLYLNLEQFGSAKDFFEAGGTFDLSDVIFAIKSNKTNLSMKLESIVKHDVSGVFFFDSCRMAFDVMEINPDDMHRLLEELKALEKYDYIIIDMDFSFNKREVEVMKQAFRIVFVSNGTVIANNKLQKALDALNVFEQKQELKLMPKVNLLYNNFRSKTGKTLDRSDIKTLGGISRIDSADMNQIIEYIVGMNVFNSFLM